MKRKMELRLRKKVLFPASSSADAAACQVLSGESICVSDPLLLCPFFLFFSPSYSSTLFSSLSCCTISYPRSPEMDGERMAAGKKRGKKESGNGITVTACVCVSASRCTNLMALGNSLSLFSV